LGASTFGASATGASWSGAIGGDATTLISGAAAATGSLGVREDWESDGPALREPDSLLVCSACCSLTFEISRIAKSPE
jgi:hypothetical protein